MCINILYRDIDTRTVRFSMSARRLDTPPLAGDTSKRDKRAKPLRDSDTRTETDWIQRSWERMRRSDMWLETLRERANSMS